MFGLFEGKKKQEIQPPLEKTENEEATMSSISSQIKWLIGEGYCDAYDPELKTILLMDDKESVISALMDDFGTMDQNYSDFLLEDYNILKFHSKQAGFNILKMMKLCPLISIDFAILDIVLGGKDIINGKKVMLDGVDIAIQLWEHFDDISIIFFTGCIVDDEEIGMFNFQEKFKNYTDEPMVDYVLPKSVSIAEEMKHLHLFLLGI